MYHSVNFGSKNSWTHWHLVPTSRPTIAIPQIKTEFQDLPLSDGNLDLSEVLLNRPVYSNCGGSFEFYVDPSYNKLLPLYSEIMAYLHGKKMNVWLEDDPNYYYKMRLELASDPDKAPGGGWSKITINYNAEPTKFER